MASIYHVAIPVLVIIILVQATYTYSLLQGIQGIKPKDQNVTEPTQDLKKFSSSQEIADYLKQSPAIGLGFGLRDGGPSLVSEAFAPQAAGAKQDFATTFSTTNIQVEGVDEADFVKNDNKYIYLISNGKLVIADAFPAENSRIVSVTDIAGTPAELFVNNDRLALFTNSYDIGYTIPEYDYLPRERYTQKVYAIIYDIADRTNPKVIKNYSINGYYFNSRMIDSFIYLVSAENIYTYGPVIDIPVIAEAGQTVLKPDVYYFDNPEENYVYNTITSFDVNGDNLNSKTFMLGYANTLYVSKDNIYLAYQKNPSYYYLNRYQEDRFYTVILPLLPSGVQNEINAIKSGNLESEGKWDKIAVVLENMYKGMNAEERKSLVQSIEKAAEEYDTKLEQERRKTVIHKIKIGNGAIEYDKKGEVNGDLLNQFSLDEYEGNLRVATTTNIFTGKSQVFNNVYLLDGAMNVIGKIEGIAPEERIYSTRFIGNRLYMVTFKRIDPFFVIDLSPENPRILGELKIPGFSDYLHPYDDNHIIGVGKDTESNEWGGVSLAGLKLALFDVSNVESPRQVDQYQIGDQGTDSEALREHKAFLFDREKNLLVIPVMEVKERVFDERFGYYKWDTWQGAYAFDVSAEGFSLKGKINHGEDMADAYSYYGSPFAVRRSLFMDNTLYTVSSRKIKANDLANLEREIKAIDLPFSQDFYPYPVGIETVTRTVVE